MVIYDLICEHGHGFEGWFKNADELAKQQANGLLSCPFCDSLEVTKKLTVPNIGKKSNSSVSRSQSPESTEQSLPAAASQNVAIESNASPEAYAQLQKMLGEVHQFIDSNFKDVGNRFAEEALSMHRGEQDAANIRGTANKEQLAELAEEGVTALPLPATAVDKKKLN